MSVVSVKLLTDGSFIIDKGLLVHAKVSYYGVAFKAALKPFLVLTDDKKVLIDTGIGELPEDYIPHYRPRRDMTLEGSLETVGLIPSDIDIVINTHLHLDHCGNDPLFENATFYVQKEELEYAFSPHRFQKGGYLRSKFQDIPFKTLKGRTNIVDGIEVIPTPGHTPGHQSVIITMGDRTEAQEGCFIYCGDAAPIRENLEKRNIIGILTDPIKALESIDTLRGIEGTHIYCHDPTQLTL